jgi:hypothetical protein
MNTKLLAAAAAGALSLAIAGAASATITFTLNEGNPDISGFPGPYGTVDVTRTSSTTANIVFTSATPQFYFLGAQAADVNVNATSWTLSALTENGAGTISAEAANNPGNVDGHGFFNQKTDLTDGFTDRSTLISFTLTNTGATTWADDASVLAANGSGNFVAAHIGVCTTTPCTAFASTGFATDGPPGVIPEPGTWAMMILGFGGMGAMLRRRRALQLAVV